MARTGGWDAIARAAFAAAALLACALAGHRACSSPAGRVLDRDPSAPWMMPDAPVVLGLRQWGRVEAPPADYRVGFALERPPARAALEVRAFGELEVRLNDAPVALAAEPGADPSDWRRFRRADVSAQLRAGPNDLRVTVRNLHGPPLLSLRLAGEDPPLRLASGSDWRVRLEDGSQLAAAVARDDRLPVEALRGPRAAAALWQVRGGLAALALVAAPVFAWLFARAGQGAWRRLPAAALAGAAVVWTALFAGAFLRLPLAFGFDAPHHLRYVEWLLASGTLPLPADDWSSYHPPLFYALSALAASLADAAGQAREPALKLLPAVSGLAHAGVALALARRLLPGRPGAAAAAALFAGLLPMNLVTASHFSNESLHGALAGLALALAVAALLDPAGPPVRGLAAFSTAVGLAALTKFTALPLAAVAGAALAARTFARVPGGRARAARLAALVLPALLVCGWFYARNVALYGRPVVGNWSLPGPGRAWWSPPGFHTSAYYASFGAALAQPFLSGVASFWDCVYTTLWGDGLLSGRIAWSARPPWSPAWMAAGMLLALPATALLGWGLVRCAGLALRDPDGGRRAAFGLLVAVVGAFGFALLYATISLPYYGQARASYAVFLTPALGLLFALGAADLDRRLAERGWLAARVAQATWAAVLFGAFARSFLPGP
jgi:hypothetical protein